MLGLNSSNKILSNIPVTPIIETPLNIPIFDDEPITDSTTSVDNNTEVEKQPEATYNEIPEPIIITDYSKQYDPILPNQDNEPKQKVEFKQIINLIRDLSSTIEKCGYMIDTEEFDMDDMYQVIFKINKKMIKVILQYNLFC